MKTLTYLTYMEELLKLTRENNKMLKEIVNYIHYQQANKDKENMNDFMMNIVANQFNFRN